MAMDPLARRLTIGFPGGSLNAARGTLEALFGEALVEQQLNETAEVTRRSHSRVRVIGGESTGVASANYTRTKYPQGSAAGAAGGEPIRMFVDGDWWTARLSGSHQAFNAFLEGSSWGSGKNAIWKSERGTPYGPFKSSSPALIG